MSSKITLTVKQVADTVEIAMDHPERASWVLPCRNVHVAKLLAKILRNAIDESENS